MGIYQENEKPVAVFDSGLGGLTVFREILRQLPDENLIYFSDKGLIFFTDAGKAIAEKACRKHALLTKALMGIGVNESTAAKEACSIEHVISDETYECLNEFFKTRLSVRASKE